MKGERMEGYNGRKEERMEGYNGRKVITEGRL
jgi:hypothetical protein